MIFFDDILAERKRIEDAIQKYGYAPEHDFYCYQYGTEEGDKNIFVAFDDGALLTSKDEPKGEWYVFSSPLADPSRRASILTEFINYALGSGMKKIWLELDAPLRKDFLHALPDTFRTMPINYTLTWPIMNLENFDAELSGGHYKSIRKERNRFYRDHRVEILDAKQYPDRQGLRSIVDRWRKNRHHNDKAWPGFYYNLVEHGFAGITEARVMVVDGAPVGMNAGWMIPHSERFYAAVGIHDYSVEDLGDMLYLEDLLWLKQKGYREADMGGGEKALTQFKKKFQPKSYYKTFIFSVVKK